LTVWAPAGAGDPERAELVVDLAARSLRHHGHALDVPYPYPKCDLVFVPDLRPLGYTPPGLGLLQDRLLEPGEEEPAAYLACVTAHEMAHAWFGGVVDLGLQSEEWVQEALATYLGRAALEVIAPGTDPWDTATSAALPDHAYAEDAACFRELEATIGRRGLLGALSALMHGHRFGTVTLDDLVRACLQTTGRDVGGWAAAARRRGLRAG
jgi:aminopeptidase N